ncbi:MULTISPECIES: 2-keto-3-deoxygluconate permease [unclassified Jeotgalibaca]|uniref:2-keto-3-deoxygluconate permease n=1 Tax=unclassified Jeotgalibaca TaxID=2621505 RepID=UPI003FD0A126
MLNAIKKVPAGTFLVPMLTSAFIYTFWPNLFQVGGLTEHIFGGAGTNGIIGAICFASGTGIDLKKIGYALKRQGVLLLAKFVIAGGISLLYISLFGQSGVMGISALAFTITICSINPAVYLSLMQQYGNEQDTAVYGITGLFSIAAVPMIIYGIASGGGMDWTPVISTLIPMAAGVVFGNLDPNFRAFFMPALPGLTFLMGWNLGYGLNLIDALQAGGGGLILAVLFYIINFSMLLIDRFVLKNDGTVGATFMTVAGLSVSTAGLVGAIYPELLGDYVGAAASQVLLVVVVTSVITPFIVAKLANQKN